jgi:SAM-dependent methyltransferase
VGTGSIAVPLAHRGYAVTGVEIAPSMLGRIPPDADGSWPIDAVVADGCQLPFSTGMFEIGLAIHYFYFVREWRMAADELARVVRPDGALDLVYTGTGVEIPALNAEYKELRAQLARPMRAWASRAPSRSSSTIGGRSS